MAPVLFQLKNRLQLPIHAELAREANGVREKVEVTPKYYTTGPSAGECRKEYEDQQESTDERFIARQWVHTKWREENICCHHPEILHFFLPYVKYS